MEPRTLKLWDKQNTHKGDRKRLFDAVRDAVGGSDVLYPGSYVDIAASMAFVSVTYVDMDARAAKFFTDTRGVQEIVRAGGGSPSADITFIAGDYRTELGIEDQSFDVLVSLYAGFVSEACTRYLRIGGVLLVAPSHGDAEMASIDPTYQLSSVVASGSGDYQVRSDDLDTYLIPKKDVPMTRAQLHERGQGIAYTRSPFAYLFTRTK